MLKSGQRELYSYKEASKYINYFKLNSIAKWYL